MMVSTNSAMPDPSGGLSPGDAHRKVGRRVDTEVRSTGVRMIVTWFGGSGSVITVNVSEVLMLPTLSSAQISKTFGPAISGYVIVDHEVPPTTPYSSSLVPPAASSKETTTMLSSLFVPLRESASRLVACGGSDSTTGGSGG